MREREKVVGIMRRKDRRNVEDVMVCFDGEVMKEIQSVLADKKTKDEYMSDSFQNIGERILRMRS